VQGTGRHEAGRGCVREVAAHRRLEPLQLGVGELSEWRSAAMPGGIGTRGSPPKRLAAVAHPQDRVARGGQIPGRYLSRRVELPPRSLSAPCATGTVSEACGRTCDVR